MPAVDDAQTFELPIGAGHSVEVDLEADGELPNRGQSLSGLEGPLYDVQPYAIHDLLIQRRPRPVVERHLDLHSNIKCLVGPHDGTRLG